MPEIFKKNLLVPIWLGGEAIFPGIKASISNNELSTPS